MRRCNAAGEGRHERTFIISACIFCIADWTPSTFASLFIIFITPAVSLMRWIIFPCATCISTFIITEFICALDVSSLLTAFRDRTTSLANSLHEPVSPRLAAALMDFLTLSSSRWMAAHPHRRPARMSGSHD